MNRSRRGLAVLILGIAFAVGSTGSASADPLWQTSVSATNEVVSGPVLGGGYPVPPGQTAPDPGTCRPGLYNSNFSESWLAVEPGTENLVGTSKYFFETFSTFYDFHLGSFTIEGGTAWTPPTRCRAMTAPPPAPRRCRRAGPTTPTPTSTSTQGPRVSGDAAVQRVLGQPAPELEHRDLLQRRPRAHLGQGQRGRPLEHAPNWSSKSLGFVEDKQWVAVNHIPGNRFQDHVYAAWAIYNGSTTKIRVAVSRDRGQSFSKATTITAPNQTGPVNEYVYPAVDAAGNVYVSMASDRPTGNDDKTIYVARSADDGVTWSRFMPVAGASTLPGCCLPNTTFRNGILEHFAASPEHPGHLYVVWEDWDGSQFDVKFSQSTNFGRDWSDAITVNDNVDAPGVPTDQFQPQVAAGPGGAVAVNFYDRRAACPDEPAILPEDVGEENFASMCPCRRSRTTVGALSGWGQRAGVGVQLGPRAAGTDDRRDRPDGVRGAPRPVHHPRLIGDYFGLAISEANVYTLAVSTHYPSAVIADGGGPVYYQQQVLETVSRADLGIN